MGWMRVSDTLHGHPKTLKISLKALGLWVACGSWSSHYGTNGHVPKAAAKQLRGTPKLVQELVDAGLWETTPTGYQFHDWEDVNPSQSTIDEARRRNRERVKAWRARNL